MTDASPLFPIFKGESGRRLLQGAVAGGLATMAIGFGLGGWNLPSGTAEKSDAAVRVALVESLAPVCAKNFSQAALAEPGMVVALRAVNAWERNTHLMEAGWASFPEGARPDYYVARECASLLSAGYGFE